MWKSPNGTIRAILDGTVFRSPITIDSIKPYVRTWQEPITIARHAYGDIYKDVEMKISGSGKAKLVFEDSNGEVSEELIHDFHEEGIVMAMHNKKNSIESFARSCFNYAIDTKQDLWFSAKDTISKNMTILLKIYLLKFMKRNIKKDLIALE